MKIAGSIRKIILGMSIAVASNVSLAEDWMPGTTSALIVPGARPGTAIPLSDVIPRDTLYVDSSLELIFGAETVVPAANASILPRTTGSIAIWFAMPAEGFDAETESLILLGDWQASMRSAHPADRPNATSVRLEIVDTTSARIAFTASGNSTGTLSSEPVVWAPGSWHHIVVTWDESGRSLYADGQLLVAVPGHGALGPDGE